MTRVLTTSWPNGISPNLKPSSGSGGGMAVIGLTNFGEHPVQSTRLAEVLGRPVSKAEALARRWGWPGTRVEDGLRKVWDLSIFRDWRDRMSALLNLGH